MRKYINTNRINRSFLDCKKMQKDHMFGRVKRREGQGVNKTCGGFGEDLQSSPGKIRTKETERGRQKDRERENMVCTIHT